MRRHPTADLAYAWSEETDEGTRYVTVLAIPSIRSRGGSEPFAATQCGRIELQSAVRAPVGSEVHACAYGQFTPTTAPPDAALATARVLLRW